MDERVAGLRQVFWNPDESRLRAPFRIPLLFVFVLLAVQLILLVIAGIELVVTLPSPVSDALALVLATVALALSSGFLDRRSLRDLGLGGGRAWLLDLLAGLAIGFAMTGVVVGGLLAAGAATVGTPAVTDPDIVLGGGTTGLLYGLLFFGGVGLFEEFALRGYLLVNVAEGVRGVVDTDRRAVLVAVVGTAALFGILHAANPGGTTLSLVNIALAGLFFGLVFAVTGRLGFPVGAHIAWNFGLGAVFGLPVSGLSTDTAVLDVELSGSPLLTGGSFGPEGGLAMLAALAVGVAAFVGWMRLRGHSLAVDGTIAIPELWSR